MSEPRRAEVVIFTDGGADPNPGTGGWAAVLLDKNSSRVKELSGGDPHTTNNRMELTAAIRALEALLRPTCVDLFTDSTYLRKGIVSYLAGWEARGWKRATGELLNVELWQQLALLVKKHDVHWQWVKGHAGNEWNERADRLATEAIRVQRAAARSSPEHLPEKRPEGGAEIFVRVATPSGRAGWVALVRIAGEETLLSGNLPTGTSNALDLVAATSALSRLPAGIPAALYTGSDYLRNGAQQWLPAWKRRGWTTKEGGTVKNRELWERLDAVLGRHAVVWPEPDEAAQTELDRLTPLARAAAHESNLR
jgi:ribonuclease HI